MLDATQLEQAIDYLGLDGVLELLADILSEKAEHLAGNWGDLAAAKQYAALADRLEALASQWTNGTLTSDGAQP
jgi:hypothetical protein